MKWNWQKPDWPNFVFDLKALAPQEQQFQLNAGRLAGAHKHLQAEAKVALVISLIRDEAITTSEIEGEWLNRERVQSSLRRQFGLQTDNYRGKATPSEEGIAKMMVDLYRNFDAPLTKEILFQWHADLMAGIPYLRVIGEYRNHPEPMQVVSGPIGKRKVHFEAPPSSEVPDMMEQFIEWFNDTAPIGSQPLPGLTRAGLTHLYFVSIHPFEDGNGRISRALSEKALAQSIGHPSLTSLSSVILEKRNDYYSALETNNRELEIQEWLDYFAKTALAGQNHSERLTDFLIAKTQFFDRFGSGLNDRQLKVVERIFEEGISGFKGGLSASNYIAIAKTSRPTATRDLADLVERGVLTKTGELKSTRYHLNLAQQQPSHP